MAFPDSSLPVALNPSVVNSIQDRTLSRTFRDALFPRLMFRAEAVAELWAINLGGNQTFTRRGLMNPTTRPLVPGVDPVPGSYSIEQWEATAQQWASSIDTNMPTSYVSLASQYLSNMHTLGLHAGQSINRVVRDNLYNAYVGGNTVTDTLASSAATTIHVVNVNGFVTNLLAGRPAPVTSANPLPITIPAIGYTGTVTAVAQDYDNIHSGTLTISPALASNLPARSAVIATNASVLVYSGGGNSVDAISSADQFSVRDIRTAIATMEFNNIPKHEDGTFHFHLDPVSKNQIFGDNEWQRLNQSLPDGLAYGKFCIGYQLGAAFFENNECPVTSNCDQNQLTGWTTGFETVNAAGVQLHRPIVTGTGAIEEKYLDEGRYISEAGVMGKIGEFAIVNGGVQVMAERIRLILRSPMDRLQQNTATSWSISGAWAIPSDQLALSSPARYKRAVVCVHGS